MTDSNVSCLDEPDLSRWGLHCFCIGARQTPHRAIAADNNGQILYFARNGATRGELAAAGVPFLESQIALLQMLGLLTTSGVVLRTTFPTLGTQAMLHLRNQSRRKAASTVQGLQSATRRIADVLVSMKAPDHQYAIAFGHGLDGLMWDSLRLEGDLPSTELSIDKPFWNGAFWAISPKRGGVAGTNEFHQGTETLVTVWTDSTVDALRALGTSWLRREWVEVLPVVCAKTGDPLHDACVEIGCTAAGALRAVVDELLADSFGGLAREQLLPIAGHEFIWDLTEQLCLLGYLEVPSVLRSGALDAQHLKTLTYVRSESA